VQAAKAEGRRTQYRKGLGESKGGRGMRIRHNQSPSKGSDPFSSREDIPLFAIRRGKLPSPSTREAKKLGGVEGRIFRKGWAMTVARSNLQGKQTEGKST